ncbi:FapA family protein [Ketobacter sp.]|uniref:FapA family protein n=1 Tax=Ketobacter sp. TaxID=2083498 RepID=UPI0025BE6344|nr:FapA family protein [Ketobacter sp.]
MSCLDEAALSVEFLQSQFNLTEFRNFYLHDSALAKVLTLYRSRLAERSTPDEHIEPVQMLVAEKRQPVIASEIAEDRMACKLIIETAYGADNPKAEELKSYLGKVGVVKGINDAVLQALSNQLDNVPAGTQITETVATGNPPGASRQAKLERLVMPVQDRLMQPKLRDNGTVDMHDFGEIEMVEVGAALVRRIPPVEGAAGFNVMGESVPAPTPQDRALNLGEGTEISAEDENLLVAARRGVPLKIDNGMMVSDAYCVGDVDLQTGNVDFDGTVVVKGSVKEGMQVKATGKVLIRDFLESATVIAGDDVVIGKGILGRQRNPAAGETPFSVMVETPGTVFANYIQYAKVVSASTVTAAKHIMHSDITGTDITVISPKKTEGKILGGIIRPIQRLHCNTLGGPSYIPTEVDFSTRIAEPLTELSTLQEELSSRLNVIRGMKEALRPIEKNAANQDAMDQIRKISNTIAHFENLVVELKRRRQQLIEQVQAISETFEVVVERAVFPGVQLVFIQQALAVKQERDGCRIKCKDDALAYFTLA